ncbi:hypothetical protein AAGG74_16645 [Bacillus mexicanus]|uniref:hypothetical protein n=1 Tax=Bacillus mexicanus TaxID=2834415 RepID=UPI003D202FB0
MQHKKIQELYDRFPDKYKPLAKFISHYLESIDTSIDYHRRLTAMNALCGIKPNSKEEAAYLATITELKQLLIKELEKTAEEVEHIGDKNWPKHYKDGLS